MTGSGNGHIRKKQTADKVLREQLLQIATSQAAENAARMTTAFCAVRSTQLPIPEDVSGVALRPAVTDGVMPVKSRSNRTAGEIVSIARMAIKRTAVKLQGRRKTSATGLELVDIARKGILHCTWGDGKANTINKKPNDASFGFVVITSPDQLQVSLDERDGSHWELFNCNDVVGEEQQIIQMFCTDTSENGNSVAGFKILDTDAEVGYGAGTFVTKGARMMATSHNSDVFNVNLGRSSLNLHLICRKWMIETMVRVKV
ncbi:MAG: hypothetical protein Q9188_006647 [Gyalolechia gomerana]